MKLNNRFIFGILSLVLAAVIAFVALPTIARQTNGKTEIVRITQPVLKGEQVTKENAEVVEVAIHDQSDDMVRFETLNSNYCLSMAPFPLAACNPLPMVSLAACA